MYSKVTNLNIDYIKIVTSIFLAFSVLLKEWITFETNRPIFLKPFQFLIIMKILYIKVKSNILNIIITSCNKKNKVKNSDLYY